MRHVLSILICSAALFCCTASLGAQEIRRAPGWALPDSKMKVYDLADYRGKVVILEFIQTDCPHCAAFADILRGVEQKYGPKIQIIGVAIAQHDTPNSVNAYITGHRVDYPVLLDSGQMAYSYMQEMHFAFPRVFVIDGNGMIRYDFKQDITNKDVYEGNGLSVAIDHVLADKGKR